jgi:Uma2 family endonuclease
MVVTLDFRSTVELTDAPDAAWIRLNRLQGLTNEQRRRLVPLCPDFVVEL